MKIILFILSFFILQTHKVLVIDENTDEPIQSANIFIYKAGINIKSGQTNEKGEFYFNESFDSIRVHSLGFNDKIYLKDNKDSILVKLSEKSILLNEVAISLLKNEKIFGDYKKRSSETRVIGKDEQFAVLLNNYTNKELKVKSILLNIKKIPNRCDLIFNFYKIDTIQRKYRNQKKNTETTLTEIIPNSKNRLLTFEYRLKPNKNKDIIEINIDSLNLQFPKEGAFISVYTKTIYNTDGIKIPITSIQQLPEIYKHKTKENNYCSKIPYKEDYWQNSNKIERHHEDTDDFRALFPMVFYEPSISVKAIEIMD